MDGEFIQPDPSQLTPEAQNQYARSSMDQEANLPVNPDEDEATVRQRDRDEERDVNEDRPILIPVEQITSSAELKTVAQRVNTYIAQPPNPVAFKALAEVLNDIRPPSGASIDDQLNFQNQKSFINAQLQKTMPIEFKGELEQENAKLSRDTQEALKSDTPRKLIEEIINRYESNDNRFSNAVKVIIKVCTDRDSTKDLPESRKKELRGIAEYAMEYATERIIGTKDDPAGSMDPFPQPNLYQSAQLDNISDYARRFDETLLSQRGRQNFDQNTGIYVYLGKLRVARQATHEVYRLLREGDKDQYKNGVTNFMGSTQLNFVENQIVGVSKAQRIYEKYYGHLISRHPGWSTPEEFVNLDKRIQGLIANNDTKWFAYDRDGNRYEQGEWQKNRAVAEGGRMSALSERRITYSITPDVPRTPALGSWLASVEGEYAARTKAPLKLLPERFMTWPGAKNFLGKIKRNMRTEQGRQYGIKVSKDGPELGLYGQSADALALIDTMNYEIKSSGWRTNKLLLSLEELQIHEINGEKVAIGDYLERQAAKAGEEAEQEGHAKGLHEHEIKALKSKIYNRAIREVIRNERFNLGILLRGGGIVGVQMSEETKGDEEGTKQIIWENIATNLPSRIASLLPGHTLAAVMVNRGVISQVTMDNVISTAEKTGQQPREILRKMAMKGEISPDSVKQAEKIWEGVMDKLMIIEEMRVENDYDALRTNLEPGVEKGEVKNLDAFFEGNLTPEEQALVKSIQKMGMDYAPQLAKITFPFTLFMDDTPRTAWNHFTAADVKRAFGDNESMEQGYGKLAGLITAPGHRPEEVIKTFHEMYQGLVQPNGPPDTQAKMVVFVEAYMELVKKNLPAKYVGGIMHALRIARSEMEQENLASDLAFDEANMAHMLRALAAEEVISDNPEGVGAGNTKLMQLRKELGADKWDVFLMWVRILMMIFGPVVAIQFLKAILPPDFQKALAA